ncbi:putative TIR domain, P-loop containing nucleoside triphosphate hydrolase [Helianthus annuus]|nr:putative TIR domain, P-loop containing nucleoside triphosphate hydrolase [Helianthus annuus]
MAASSSASFVKESFQYDVFLSFSGEDTRKNFVDHLYAALEQHGIHTFKDDERLKQGKSINNQLLKSIEESKLFIIVFSKNYASSSWCLNELVKIMECQKSNNQIAYPVFYDVDPSEVRKQRGPVGEALAKHTNIEIGKWREALTEAANLSGWDLPNIVDGHEAKVIKLIIARISLELRPINVNLDDTFVGMEPRLQDLEKSLDIASNEVHMIGIKGMGGAGKTTLARAVFDRISVHFEAKSFVENVREVSKASLSGLLSLQRKILSDLLNGQGNNVGSVHEGTNMLKSKLRGRKVLVILDDVDHKDQLEALAGDIHWFKPGSRIIITTRDEQVLIAHRVERIRDVSLLSHEEAIGLFSRHAFGKDLPIQEYERESQQVVQYAAGLPLSIKVLGSFMCGKDKPEWVDALERLKTIPLKETLEKLELSYASLEDDYKEIFLDVACILKGWEKNEAISMLESCGFQARIGLRILEQRSLITFHDYGFGPCLSMHDHIEEMGKNIVRRLHPDEPTNIADYGSRKKLKMYWIMTWCIRLRLTPNIVLEGLGNMKNLRCLIVDHYYMDNSFVKIDEVLKKLKSIILSRSKLKTLDLGLTPNLVRLKSVSFIKDLESLGNLNVSGLHLKEFQNIILCHSNSNLQQLDFGGNDIENLPSSIGNLHKLVMLSFNRCYKLKSLPGSICSLHYLSVLSLVDCGIEELPEDIGQLECLEVLDLTRSKIKHLPDSICKLKHLRVLILDGCKVCKLPEDVGQIDSLYTLDLRSTKIRDVPSSICKLKHLKELQLSNCSELEKLPENLGDLESLDVLVLTSTKIRDVPSSICKLKHLKYLRLSKCSGLEKLPENLGDLESLDTLDLRSTKIRDVPSSICKLKHLEYLDLSECSELEKLPENLGDLESLEELDLTDTPINHLPDSISLLKGFKITGYERRIDPDAILF